jgi:hypothetical protein
MFVVYNSNAAYMPSATRDLWRAKAILESVAHNFDGPAYLLVEGKNDWALRSDGAELGENDIPTNVRRANEREN